MNHTMYRRVSKFAYNAGWEDVCLVLRPTESLKRDKGGGGRGARKRNLKGVHIDFHQTE